MKTVTINSIDVQVPEDYSVLDACDKAGVFVPRICYHHKLPPAAKCGLCLVKVEGQEDPVPACATDIEDGMKINTLDENVGQSQYEAFKKYESKYNLHYSPEIVALIKYFELKGKYFDHKKVQFGSLIYNPVQCTGCFRCFRACKNQNLNPMREGPWKIEPTKCIACGQCTLVCPTKGLSEKSSISAVLKAFAAGKIVILQVSQSVKFSVAECFGEPIGTISTGKIVDAAKVMGFKYVFDGGFASDIAIIEEGSELLQRIIGHGVLPLFSNSCAAWVSFVKKFKPELLPHLSTTKSSHLILGSLIKSYFANPKVNSLNPKDVFVVSLSSCLANKNEIETALPTPKDVDAVITTREFVSMIETFGIEWKRLKEKPFDPFFNESSSSSIISPVTGGIMEATLRYVHEKITDRKLGDAKYVQFRGSDSIRTSEIIIGKYKIKAAVCNGIAAAQKFIESPELKDYTFIEVMSCPNGCISGGGQPKLRGKYDIQKRVDSVYTLSGEIAKPTPDDNSQGRILYKSFLIKPNDEKSKELLHVLHQRRK